MGGEAKKHGERLNVCQTFTDMVKAIFLTDDMLSTEEANNSPIAASCSAKRITDPRREDILTYIDRIRSLMTDQWKAR